MTIQIFGVTGQESVLLLGHDLLDGLVNHMVRQWGYMNKEVRLDYQLLTLSDFGKSLNRLSCSIVSSHTTGCRLRLQLSVNSVNFI